MDDDPGPRDGCGGEIARGWPVGAVRARREGSIVCRRTRKVEPVEDARALRLPGFSAEAAVYRSGERYLPGRGAAVPGRGLVIVPQQIARFCLPCFLGRRACCEYRYGRLRCYSSRC